MNSVKTSLSECLLILEIYFLSLFMGAAVTLILISGHIVFTLVVSLIAQGRLLTVKRDVQIALAH